MKKISLIIFASLISFGLFAFGQQSVSAQTVSFQAKLTEPNGETPVQYAYAYMYTSNYSNYYSAYSDSEGNVLFYDMNPGTYIVQISKPYGLRYAAPPSFEVTINPESTIDYGKILFKNPNITGRLLGENDEAVQSHYAYIRDANYATKDYAYTDSSGRFSLYVYDAGTYYFSTSDNIYYNFQTPGDISVTLTTPGETKDLGDVESLRTNIMGIFADKNNTPITNGGVSLYNSTYTVSKWATTNASGAFEFYAPVGTYALKFYGYNSGSDPADVSVTVTDANTVTNLGTIKQLTPNLTVKVKDPAGAPVSGASVYVWNKTYYFYRYMTTNSSGIAETGLTGTDTYTMSVYANHPTYKDPNPVSFDFTSGETKSIEMTLQQPGLLIDVKDPDGNPISGVSVSVYPENNYDWQNSDWASTDSNGRAGIKPLATGTYKVSFYYYNYYQSEQWVAPSSFTLSLTNGVQNTTYTGSNAIRFSRPTKTFKGKITLSSGGAVNDAYIYGWDSENYTRWFSTSTNDSGEYFVKMGGGKYTIYIYPKNWPANWGFFQPNPVIQFIEDETEETITKNFSVSAYSSTIKGLVRYSDGSVPPSNDYVSVYANNSDMGFWGYAQTTDGAWSMKAPAGTFTVSAYTSNMLYSAPQEITVSVKEGETVDIGKLIFAQKKEKINVKVIDTNGTAILGASVSAWRDGGSWDYAWGTTGSDGTALLNTTTGTWTVRADYWSWFSSSSVKYASIEDPKTVELSPEETENVTITLGIANSTANIGVVDKNGQLASDFNGWVDISKSSKNTSMYSYSGLGGMIQSGKGSIAVPSGTWVIRMYSWGDKWSVTGDTEFTIGENTSKDIEVTIAENNSTIKGSFKDTDGDVITSLSGWMFAENGKGNYQYATPNNGSYSFKVAVGTWTLTLSTYGNTDWILKPDQTLETAIGENEEKTIDIIFVKNDAAIEATVLDPDGNPKPNVYVSLKTKLGKSTLKAASYYSYNQTELAASTDQYGKAKIKAPAGTYYVSASAPLSEGLMNPEAQVVELEKDKTTEATLQFMKANATITGTVTLNGQGTDAAVYGYSGDGQFTTGEANASGDYSINVVTGEDGNDWYVTAIDEDGGAYYATEAETKVVVETANTSVETDLTLDPDLIALPDSETVTIDANRQSSVVLENDTELVMPDNALTTSDVNVTVTVDPTAELPRTAEDHPVTGYGYEVHAVQADGQSAGQEITDLSAPVTMKMTYTDAQIQQEGVNEEDLTVKYWSEEEGAWRQADGVNVDADANSASGSFDHLTLFAIMAAGGSGKTKTVPTVSLRGPENQSIVAVPQVLVEGTVSDKSAQVTIQLNEKSVGKAVVSTKGEFSEIVKDLKIGENTLEITAKTSAGTSPTVKRTVTYNPLGAGEDSGDESSIVATGIQKDIIAFKNNGSSEVRVIDQNGKVKKQFFAFGEKVTGTYHLLVADIDGDSKEEIIVATGNGLAPQIRVFTKAGKLVTQLYAYGKNGTMGAKFVFADLNGDRLPELLTRPAGKAKALINVYSYKKAKKKYQLLTQLDASSKFGKTPVKIMTADVTGDDAVELIVSPDGKAAPIVKVYSFQAKPKPKLKLLDSETVLSKKSKMGVKVFARDFTGDDVNDLLVVPTTGATAMVSLYQFHPVKERLTLLASAYPYGKKFKGEMNARIADVNADNQFDLVLAPHSKRGPEIMVMTFSPRGNEWKELSSFNTLNKKFMGGLDIVMTNVDKDDYPEIAVMPRSQGQPDLRLYEYNKDKEKFVLLDSIMTHEKTLRSQMEVLSVDLEGDGDFELLIAPLKGSPKVTVVDWLEKKTMLSAKSSFFAFDKSYQNGVKFSAISQ